MTHPIAHRLALRAVAQEEAAKVVPKNVPDKHQLKILIDTLKMHPAMAGDMGGPSREEAEEILKSKFKWTDADIHKIKHAAGIVQRVAQRFLAAESEQGSISRPTPSAEAEPEAPDEDEWASYEKRGEWNLIIYHHGGRRNLSYFMKNPQGGGGGSNDGTSVKGLVKQVINHNVGWSSPHINPEKKDKVWVVVVQFTGEGPHWWKPIKQWWEPVPKELLVPKEKKPMTNQEYYERLTR
jgi:hypothetical protein